MAVLASRVRMEEKLLFTALERRGVRYEAVDTRSLAVRLDEFRPPYRGALSREISHYRAYYAACLLEHAGVPVVNPARTIRTCGDKLLTTLALRSAGLPTPPAMVALTPAAALSDLPAFGYPSVIKPLTGSWGRLAARVTDGEVAQAVIEHRAALPGAQSQITYVQRYVDKPGRDIRGLVAGDDVLGAIYRTSSHWRTSTAHDSSAVSPCPVGEGLRKLLLATAGTIGPGVYGIDILEDREGALYVNEVNHTPEFHGAIAVLGDQLVDRYLDFALEQLRDQGSGAG